MMDASRARLLRIVVALLFAGVIAVCGAALIAIRARGHDET